MSANWPTGTGRLVFDSLPSTNLEAKNRADQAPLWVLAHRQTAGVGRRGRAWSTEAGNFAGSLIIPMPKPVENAALYSFVTALALSDTLLDFGVQPDRVSLKWPNDVLLDGGKLAGILLEGAGAHMIIGIGVNLTHRPDAPDAAFAPTTLKSALGQSTPSPEAFLDCLGPNLDTRAGELARAGFAPLREAWLSKAARLGAEITARLPDRDITGIFETLDDQGRLRLKTTSGTELVAAGDVFFPDQGGN